MSFVAIWRFSVRPGSEEKFLQAYGPEGAWVMLFRKGNGFVSTELVRDVAMPRVYVTIDRWESEAAYRSFRKDHAAEYAAIDHLCADLTDDEQMLAECSSAWRTPPRGRETRANQLE